MIVRVLVIDPNDPGEVLLYQLPEKSRNLELFLELLVAGDVEHVSIEGKRRERKTEEEVPPVGPSGDAG